MNDMGHMDTCKFHTNNSLYSVIKTKKKDLLYKMSFGYCGENNCSASDLNEVLKLPQGQLLKEVVTNFTANHSGYTNTDYDFEFSESYSSDLGLLGYLVLFTMMCLITPSLYMCYRWMASNNR